MELKNCMEDFVWEKLKELLAERPDVCKCDRCLFDMAALALNNLPPRYVITHRGEALTRAASLAQQFGTDLVTAVCNAINTVSARPHHC